MSRFPITHPYTRGYSFWSTTGAFWRDPKRKFSKRTVEYYEKWLADMRSSETQLKRL